MPRSPVTYFLPPGTTPQAPNTTIGSAMFNAAMDDIANTFNQAQPIEFGGTGGTSVITGYDGLNSRGADIPTASSVNLDNATGPNLHLTGATTVATVTLANGAMRQVVADSAFQITASANLIVNGSTSSNYTTTVGDSLLFIGDDAGVVRVWAAGAAGLPLTGGTLSTTSAGTLLGLISTNSGATSGPDIDFYRNSSTPAAPDILSKLVFNGNDSGGNKQEYASLEATIKDPTNGSEAGSLDVYTTVAGSRTKVGTFGPQTNFVRQNYVIDGRFDYWSVGTSVSATGYGAADMWRFILGSGASATFSRQSFTLGQTDVPGNPVYFGRINRTVVGSTPTSVRQYIEGVANLSGGLANFQLYVKGSTSMTATLSFIQNFGSGGSPSSQVTASSNISVTTSWQLLNATFNVASVSGKTLGTTPPSNYIAFDIGLPTAAGNVSLDVCLVQVSANPLTQEYVYDQATEQKRVMYYFEKLDGTIQPMIGNGFVESTNEVSAAIFYQWKRTAPDINFVGTVGFDQDGFNLQGMTVGSIANQYPSSSRINATGGTGTGTPGEGGLLFITGGGASYATVDSRLPV